MAINFLFIFFAVGILIACIQDIKRREIDRWLTYILLIGGFLYLIVGVIINRDYIMFFQMSFSILIMFLLSNLLYYSKFFAGGDSNLLFSMSAFFVGRSVLISSLNILSFIVILFISGGLYGLFYSLFLYFKNFEEVNKSIKYNFKKTKLKYFLLVSLPFFIFSFLHIFLLPLAVMLFLFPILFVLTKALEEKCLTKTISTSNLRSGDWINEDIKIKNKIIKSSFYGVNEEDIKLLKLNENITIKEGIPFAPVFLISLLVGLFLFEKIFTFIYQFFL